MAYTPNLKAYEMPGNRITLVPNASFATKQYTFVKPDASAGMVAAGAGLKAAGVLQTPGIAGEPCRVMTSGVSFIKLGGTVAAGAQVEADANGAAIALSTGISNGICIVGGSSGQIGCILVK